MRKYTLNRWNFSESTGKWVYVTKEKCKRKYIYQLEPPEEFIKLSYKIKEINEKLVTLEEEEEIERLYNEMMEISKKMQAIKMKKY